MRYRWHINPATGILSDIGLLLLLLFGRSASLYGRGLNPVRLAVVPVLRAGIAAVAPPNVVMKWTGHFGHKAMKPYIDIVGSIRAREMTKMDFMD